MTTSTRQVLHLVERALDEVDEVPVSTTIRRVARIASLLGDERAAVRFSLELKPTSGGDPRQNGADSQRMMKDPSSWGSGQGPAEDAVEDYTSDRRVKRDEKKIWSHSVEELEHISQKFSALESTATGASHGDLVEQHQTIRNLLGVLKHRAFAHLCAWERQLNFSETNERIFERFQREVDALLASVAPELLETFNSVQRRLRDAANAENDIAAAEELSQAVTTCRRILKAVVDRVAPAALDASRDEHGVKLDDEHYRARLREYVRSAQSATTRDSAEAQISDVYARFRALDHLASKGVHASLARAEAELCAITTYILAGEMLRQWSAPPDPGS